jgi:hypothetical protein
MANQKHPLDNLWAPTRRQLLQGMASGMMALALGGVTGLVLAPDCEAQAAAVDNMAEGDDDAPVAKSLTRADRNVLKKGAHATLAGCKVRVRALKVAPAATSVLLAWRQGGEGLGGKVTSGVFPSVDSKPGVTRATVSQMDCVPPGTWSAPVPLSDLIAMNFLTVDVANLVGMRRGRPQLAYVDQAVVEMELTDSTGQVFKTLSEAAPAGATVSFYFPVALVSNVLQRQGYLDAGKKAARVPFVAKEFPEFVATMSGLLGYVQARHARLAAKYGADDKLPQKYGVVGRLAGLGKAGYAVRHSNPEIIKVEGQTLHVMGFNGLSDTNTSYLTNGLVPAGQFEREYWGGGGVHVPSPSPRGGQDKPFSPIAPELLASRQLAAQAAIANFSQVKAQEKWGIGGDEIGVSMKAGIESFPGSREYFQKYLQSLGVAPAEVGAATLSEVAPYALYVRNAAGKAVRAPRPATATERRRLYYTFRYMTYVTGQAFTQPCALLKKAGVLLYSQQGPTPSWGGHTLDWNEFYDQAANTALVFETSNRDARVWQWESFLNDIMRGIAARHGMAQGQLIKPHRGAPKQRMITALARGVTSWEWYTYGPDYAKGDSFSSRPDLLDAVAEADRFAAAAEPYIYGAHWAGEPQVAFVRPRSGEIWDGGGNVDAFEDAKWVYLALRHAGVPVDILSEQQLMEGKLPQYKVLYVVGSNLHHLATAMVRDWVQAGGVLWTDALSFSRDEADDPVPLMNEILGLGQRQLELWGSVARYGATSLPPIVEETVPPGAAVTGQKWRAVVGREPLNIADAAKSQVLAKFADGHAAAVRHTYGNGAAYTLGFHAGLAYSATVRRPDFDMLKDYDASLRALIVAPVTAAGVTVPVTVAVPTVEAVLLQNGATRSIALMNWTYAAPKSFIPLKNLRVDLPGVGDFKTVRSLKHGALTVQGAGTARYVQLPLMEETDLLILDA